MNGLLILGLFFLVSCLPSFNKSSLDFHERSIALVTGEFQKLQENVLEPHCLSCHTQWRDNENEVLKHVINGDVSKSRLYLSVEEGSMPKGRSRLGNAELALIQNYIESLPRVPGQPASTEQERVTFEILQEKILVPHCLGCHRSWRDDESKVSTKVVPGEPEKSRLFLSIQEGSMPKGRDPLPTSDLEIVRSYIEGLVIFDRQESP